MTEYAPLTQIYGEVCESDELLPMGDVGVEFGYVLYQAAITVPAASSKGYENMAKEAVSIIAECLHLSKRLLWPYFHIPLKMSGDILNKSFFLSPSVFIIDGFIIP